MEINVFASLCFCIAHIHNPSRFAFAIHTRKEEKPLHGAIFSSYHKLSSPLPPTLPSSPFAAFQWCSGGVWCRSAGDTHLEAWVLTAHCPQMPMPSPSDALFAELRPTPGRRATL